MESCSSPLQKFHRKRFTISTWPQSSSCLFTILTAWSPSRLFGVALCLVGGQSLLHWPVQGGRKTIYRLNFKLHEILLPLDSVHTHMHTSQSRWSLVWTKPERLCITSDRILNVLSFSNAPIFYSFCSYLSVSAVVFVRNLCWKP